MSITDELRKYANRFKNSHDAWSGIGDDLTAIADRIDVEYQKAIRELNGLAEDSVLLPKDADNVPWNVGDRDEDGNVVTELRLTYDGCWFVITDGEWPYRPKRKRHYHAPTVENVLREFANECLTYATCVDDHEVADAIELYAAKLRLAEGEDA